MSEVVHEQQGDRQVVAKQKPYNFIDQESIILVCLFETYKSKCYPDSK